MIKRLEDKINKKKKEIRIRETKSDFDFGFVPVSAVVHRTTAVGISECTLISLFSPRSVYPEQTCPGHNRRICDHDHKGELITI